MSKSASHALVSPTADWHPPLLQHFTFASHFNYLTLQYQHPLVTAASKPKRIVSHNLPRRYTPSWGTVPELPESQHFVKQIENFRKLAGVREIARSCREVQWKCKHVTRARPSSTKYVERASERRGRSHCSLPRSSVTSRGAAPAAPRPAPPAARRPRPPPARPWHRKSTRRATECSAPITPSLLIYETDSFTLSKQLSLLHDFWN